MLQSQDGSGNVCGTEKKKDMEYAEFKLRTATNAKIVATLAPAQKLEWALVQKKLGNELYAKDDFEGAISKYMDAIVGIDLSVEGALKQRMEREIMVPVPAILLPATFAQRMGKGRAFVHGGHQDRFRMRKGSTTPSASTGCESRF